MIFDHDWWFGTAYGERVAEARNRCAAGHFPKFKASEAAKDPEYVRFLEQLEARTIVYLRDGFSYELRQTISQNTTGSLTFECMPADEAYKVGAFVVTVPFDEIVRVEVFAFHPREKPEDMPSIKGFAGGQPPPQPAKRDDRPPRREAQE